MNRHLAPLAILLAAACGGAKEEAPRTKGEEIPLFSAFSDPTQIIVVKPGATFRIALQSGQGSTGYRWVLVDSARMGPIRAVGSEYRVPPELRDRDGAGGTETWTFNAPTAGTGAISMIHVPPWETAAPRDTTRFRVAVVQ